MCRSQLRRRAFPPFSLGGIRAVRFQRLHQANALRSQTDGVAKAALTLSTAWKIASEKKTLRCWRERALRKAKELPGSLVRLPEVALASFVDKHPGSRRLKPSPRPSITPL